MAATGIATSSDSTSAEERLPLVSSSGATRSRKQIMWPSAAVMITNSAIGAGLLAFPSAFAEAGGYVPAICLLLTITVFSFVSLMICSYCATLCRCTSYQSMVSLLVHRVFGSICAMQMFLYTFGSCVSYLIILGDQCDQVYALIYGDVHNQNRPWYFSRRFLTIIISVVIVLPLCLPKRIEFLRYVSAVTNLCLLYLVALVITSFFVPTSRDMDQQLHSSTSTNQFGDNPPGTQSSVNWIEALFSALPIVCFGFQCEINAIPVYAAQRRQTVGEFARVNAAAMLFTCVVYMLTGAFGYATFGSHVESDVLLSYSPSAQVTVAVIIVCILMVSAYPLMSFVARTTVVEYVVKFIDLCNHPSSSNASSSYDRLINDSDVQQRHEREMSESETDSAQAQSDPLARLARGSRTRERVYRIVITLVWFTATLSLALFIPSLGKVIGVLGTFAACFIFVYPGLCLLNLTLAVGDHSALENPNPNPNRYRVTSSGSSITDATVVNASTEQSTFLAQRVAENSLLHLSKLQYFALLFLAVLLVSLGVLMFVVH